MFRHTRFIREATRLAFESVWAHRLRTFLTLLGIIIGVASVILVGAGIEGLQGYVLEMVSKTLGSNSFVVAKYPRFGNLSEDELRAAARRNQNVRLEDLSFLDRRCTECAVLAGEISSTRTVNAGGAEIRGTQISGVTANRILFGSQSLAEGRYFTEEEVRRSRPVAVIGWDLRETLFENNDPLGRIFRIGSQAVQVIGVLEELGTMLGQPLDNVAHIPITTFQKFFGKRSSIRIRGSADDEESFKRAVEQVRVGMRIRHQLRPSEDDDFGLTSTEEINNWVDEFTQSVAVVVLPITLISLLVGGIVIMNIMLVSVTERTFEVGLRKSLGARRRDILVQFLIEAVIVAALGGTIGLALAALGAEIIGATTEVPMRITPAYVLLSIGVSGGVGLIFGLYPAMSASRLDPIEALRQER